MKLNVEGFKQEVFDYTKDKEWNFKGERPMVIDFYADWCGPCKMLAPVMNELSDEYAGKVDVRKVDTDRENELAQIFWGPKYSLAFVHSQIGKVSNGQRRPPKKSSKGDYPP